MTLKDFGIKLSELFNFQYITFDNHNMIRLWKKKPYYDENRHLWTIKCKERYLVETFKVTDLKEEIYFGKPHIVTGSHGQPIIDCSSYIEDVTI